MRPGPKFVLRVLIVAGVATALMLQHQSQVRLRQEIQRLGRQLAELQDVKENLSGHITGAKIVPEPRLPAPPTQPASPTPAPAEERAATNLFAQFKDPPDLTAEQVQAYLQANGRKVSTLLAAYRTSCDPALLQEAMRNYPADPQVAFEAAFSKDLSPEQRRQWLDAFEQAAPENALANYLSARDYLQAGQANQAVQELITASGKRQFQDYTLDRRQDDEEAYLAAGYSTGAAKMIASGQVELPQLAQLKQLGLQMVELASSYRQAGDEASAQSLLQMTATLGQRYGPGDCAISHLVGVAIERNALGAMASTSPYGDTGQTVQDRLDQLAQLKTTVKSLFEQGEPLLEGMSDRDWISYIDRDKAYGEEAAMKWALGKFGRK